MSSRAPGRPSVLVVEDDATVADVVSRYLAREGFEVVTVGDGLRALEHAADALPDLVILDLMLPGVDGFEVMRRLREIAPVPVMVLTARGDEDDRIYGLRVGADDYVSKPFSPRELTARAVAVLRRAGHAARPQEAQGELTTADLRVDPLARCAWRGEVALTLTPLEFDLLVFLMRHPGRAFRREELLQGVWGYTFGDLSTVTVHVRRLREKIEDDPARPRRLKTVWGVGYRFDPEDVDP